MWPFTSRRGERSLVVRVESSRRLGNTRQRTQVICCTPSGAHVINYPTGRYRSAASSVADRTSSAGKATLLHANSNSSVRDAKESYAHL